ncbi:MAG: hypothetical protein BroJett026_33550 [Betaproteobacteria bacterium]|nr:MAG: hypothetical protein BroJett026_33550 [Betaproteobacteria bacterium]
MTQMWRISRAPASASQLQRIIQETALVRDCILERGRARRRLTHKPRRRVVPIGRAAWSGGVSTVPLKRPRPP